MSIRDRLLPTRTPDGDSGDSTEQLAPTDASEVDPKGEQRATSGSGGFFSIFRSDRDERAYTRSSGVETDVTVAPKYLEQRYHQYVRTVPLVYSPLSIFSDAVSEPGWTVEAKIDGEIDGEMTEALELWGANCAIHSQEPGHDIIKLVEYIPEKRRGKGTLFFEKVRDSEGNFVALMPLKPSTMSTFAREDQPILVQPDDDVPQGHPRTGDGDAAAYVQYHNDRDDFADRDQNEFTVNDIVKVTFNERTGSAWGTPLWVTIREHVDGLYQKLRDRNASIRINGHPWRVIQNDSWDQREAQSFLTKHFEGEFSTWLSQMMPGRGNERRGPHDEKDRENSFAGRVDAVPHNLEIDEYAGEVPDIEDAIQDDIEAIFSVMPVSKFKIAYEESINQFVVEPQSDKDERNAVKERQRVREAIEPLFEEKADELASGDSYDGEVTWKLEQPTDENPLERESFDAEAFKTTADAAEPYGASAEFMYWLAGVDPDQFEDGPLNDPEGNPSEGWEPDPLDEVADEPPNDEVDEETEADG